MNKYLFFVSTLSVFLFALLTHPVDGKWMQANGPYGARVNAFGFRDSVVFAGTNTGGIFRSTDIGKTWKFNHSSETRILSFAVSDSFTFAGTTYGIIKSSNNDTIWKWVDTKPHFFDDVASLVVVGDTVIAGTLGDGMFRSTDNGST